MRQQGRHSELGDCRENRLNRFQVHFCVSFPTKPLGQRRSHIIAERIGDDHIALGIGRSHIQAIEVTLLADLHDPSILPHLIRAGIGPAAAELGQEPAHIQALHLFHHGTEEIRQFDIIFLQARRIAAMELPVVCIHEIILRGVLLPDLRRLHGMETGSMGFEEGLHAGDLKKPLIVVPEILIPGTDAPLLHRFRDHDIINDMVPDLGHKLNQNHFIDTGENLRVQKIGDLQLHKALRELETCFHLRPNIPEGIRVLRADPIGNEVVAPRLMNNRNEGLQPGKMLLTHGTGRGRQKDMRRERFQIMLTLKAGPLLRQLPECIHEIITGKLLIPRILLRIQAVGKDRLQQRRRLCLIAAKQYRHHGKHQLARIHRRRRYHRETCPILLTIEERTEALHAAAQSGCLLKMQLIHPHGNQVRTELLAVELHVQKPVRLQRLIGQRTIEQIIAVGIIHSQRLLHLEAVGTGQGKQLRPIHLNGIQLIFKLTILVIPYDNSALIELRQRLRKPAVQILYDSFGIHQPDTPVS